MWSRLVATKTTRAEVPKPAPVVGETGPKFENSAAERSSYRTQEDTDDIESTSLERMVAESTYASTRIPRNIYGSAERRVFRHDNQALPPSHTKIAQNDGNHVPRDTNPQNRRSRPRQREQDASLDLGDDEEEIPIPPPPPMLQAGSWSSDVQSKLHMHDPNPVQTTPTLDLGRYLEKDLETLLKELNQLISRFAKTHCQIISSDYQDFIHEAFLDEPEQVATLRNIVKESLAVESYDSIDVWFSVSIVGYFVYGAIIDSECLPLSTMEQIEKAPEIAMSRSKATAMIREVKRNFFLDTYNHCKREHGENSPLLPKEPVERLYNYLDKKLNGINSLPRALDLVARHRDLYCISEKAFAISSLVCCDTEYGYVFEFRTKDVVLGGLLATSGTGGGEIHNPERVYCQGVVGFPPKDIKWSGLVQFDGHPNTVKFEGVGPPNGKIVAIARPAILKFRIISKQRLLAGNNIKLAVVQKGMVFFV